MNRLKLLPREPGNMVDVMLESSSDNPKTSKSYIAQLMATDLAQRAAKRVADGATCISGANLLRVVSEWSAQHDIEAVVEFEGLHARVMTEGIGDGAPPVRILLETDGVMP